MSYESDTAARYTGKTRFKEAETACKPMNPVCILHDLIEEGYTDFTFTEKWFSDGERLTDRIPEKGDYFSMIYAGRKER